MAIQPSVREAMLRVVPSLRAFAISLCGNVDRADDLVQETLLRALANAHLWQPGSDLRAWLFTIMRNQFFAVVSKSNRSPLGLEDVREAAEDCCVTSPDARLMLRDVAAALGRLPSKQRSALLLVGIDGNSYEEAAKRMGISVAAVRCHLARGRERLRTALHGVDAVSPCAPRSSRMLPAMMPSADFRGLAIAHAVAGAD